MRLIVALATLLILLGVGLIAYPYVSDYLNRVEQSKISNKQAQVVAETSVEDLSSEADRARDFNERLIAGRAIVTDPFDPANETPTDEEYESVLNLAGDGVMGNIVIPKIDVDLPIYHGVDGEGLEHGVGHMPSTTLPIGGKGTHTALAGHTGLPSARIFDSLTEIHEGDWFIITVLGEDMAYEVTGTEVVLPDETKSLHVEEGEDLVTLVTCTPYGVNTHRLLVHARRCDIPEAWLRMKEAPAVVPFISETVAETPKFMFTAAGLGASLVLLIVWALVARRLRKRAATAPAMPAPSSPAPRHARHAVPATAPAQPRRQSAPVRRPSAATVPERTNTAAQTTPRRGAHFRTNAETGTEVLQGGTAGGAGIVHTPKHGGPAPHKGAHFRR